MTTHDVHPTSTMCDFLDFGLTFFSIMCIQVIAQLPQRLKSMFTPLAHSGPLRSKKFQKTLILAFEANSALSCENKTKIVKITHSAMHRQFSIWAQLSRNDSFTIVLTGHARAFVARVADFCLIFQTKLKIYPPTHWVIILNLNTLTRFTGSK